MSKFAKIQDGRIVTFLEGVGDGIAIPEELSTIPPRQLFYDGTDFIDAATLTEFRISDQGEKFLPSAVSDELQLLTCAFSDDLIKDDGVWRVATAGDRFDERKAEALAGLSRVVEEYRAIASGNLSAAKALELAEQSRIADRLLAGETVSAAAISEAESEMFLRGLSNAPKGGDVLVIAGIWQDENDARLGTSRTINNFEASQRNAISSTSTTVLLQGAIDTLYNEALPALRVDLGIDEDDLNDGNSRG